MNSEDLPRDLSFALMPYPAVEVEHAEQGPLAGLSFAVKDLFDVAGYPTASGNPTLLAMSGIKRTTAPTVQRLLDAGARMIGKAQTNELAFSMSGKNAHFGTPRNGAAPERIPGGSSSGSASAVSNGLCDFALGTDTGGSVRTPASYCGLYGLRPSHGRISLQGCLPLCASMDTCGFFAREPEVFARVAECLLGEDSAALDEAPALSSAMLMARLPAASRAALAPAVAHIGRVCGGIEAFSDEWPSLEQAYWAFRYIQGHEAWQAQGETILRDGLVLGPDVSARFSWGRQVSEEQLVESNAFRANFRAAVEALLGDRVLILPTVADIAPRLDAEDEEIERTRTIAHHLLGIAVLCGLPQVNLPLAEKDGAPLGISLLAGPGRDLALVRLAARIGASLEG